MADGLTANISGLEELIVRSALVETIVMAAMAAGLYTEGEVIMGRSKDEFVPVDTGALKSTGHVEKPVTNGHEVTVELGYGGPTGVQTADGKDYVGYALYVHDGTSHMEGQHYLERPAMEEAPELGNRVGAVVASAIGAKL